jgi:hypothetical protein
MLHSILPTYTVPALEDLEQFPHVRNSELTLYIHPRYVSVIHCDFRTPGGCGDWQIHQKYGTDTPGDRRRPNHSKWYSSTNIPEKPFL